MALTLGFFTSSFGTVTVSTPFSMLALTSSIFAFSGSLNLRRNFPLLLSIWCHFPFLSSCSLLLSPLIWSTRPSSTSTVTSSFFNPGRSALKMWASGVSFQSQLVLEKADLLGSARVVEKGKPLKGSQISRENGSNMQLGMKSDMFLQVLICIENLGGIKY